MVYNYKQIALPELNIIVLFSIKTKKVLKLSERHMIDTLGIKCD